MNAVPHVSDLRSMIGSAKTAGGAFGTNLFLTDASLEPVVRAGRLSALESTGAVIFLKRETLFDRLYYAAADTRSLATAICDLALPETGALVVDLIGRRSEIEPWVSQFEGAGFTVHSTILRMSRAFSKPPPVEDLDHGTEAAEERDTTAIQAMLAAGFDPYADQLPELEEIAQAAAQGTILVIRDASRIAALLYYDRRGLTTVFRYWLIPPEYRTQGLSDKLMRRYFQNCSGCRRSILWVHESNNRGILVYKWYGYQPDSIVDVVLIKR